MTGNEKFVEKTIGFIQAHICPLTNLKECKDAVERYRSHENELRLVDDVFNVLMTCKDDHCMTNVSEVKEKLESYLKENANEV